MSTEERPQARVDRPDLGDLELAIHGLGGIFWALNMLVVHHAADDIARDRDRENGIAALIVAGGLVTGNLKERF